MSQSEKILDYFRKHPTQLFAAHQISDLVFSGNILITSTRRAISNLELEGFLVKTPILMVGPHSKFVQTWQLSTDQQRKFKRN